MSPLAAVILAAGQGKRMRSALPKVLHPLGARPLLEHVVEAARALGPQALLVVYGHGGEQVRERLGHLEVAWVEQRERLGTGHALAQAMPRIEDQATVLVLYGDVPLVSPRTLARVAAAPAAGAVGLLTAHLDDPTGYGRIRRDAQGRVTGIVEERDADAAMRRVNEVNTGILAAPAARLRRWLAGLDDRNAQGELYLTDIVALAVAEEMEVRAAAPERTEEILGVNDRAQLAHLERCYQRAQAERLMADGVTLRDPARLDVRGEVTAAPDVTIDVNVVLGGRVVLAEGVSIGPGVVLADAELGPGVEVLSHSVIEGARIAAGCRVGPFARIRPGTRLAEGVHVGNFVEVKKSDIGPRSKVNHLSYVGDAEVGRDVNVGAGTITCNYDGANKHRTVIEDQAFIGSGTELVAPVRVGAGATIGAGSTIGKDAPPGKLTLTRSRQNTVEGWQRPVKKDS